MTVTKYLFYSSINAQFKKSKQTMAEKSAIAIKRILDASRRKLLDTGTRNRLIHVNRARQRANCLNVINERSDDIFLILRGQEKRMCFKAMGKDSTVDGQKDIYLAAHEVVPSESTNRFTDSFIETPLGPDELARRLLRLAMDAKTAEEEQGVNILYLAIGFLRWRESSSSEMKREAPLILLPVQLVRNERTSTYDIRCRDDDITPNLPLHERLLQDFGITLPDIKEDEDWKPSDYFYLVKDCISGKEGWSIDANGMQLGFFSFAKLLMYRDLNLGKDLDSIFADNPLFKGILVDGFPEDTPLFGPKDKLDEKLDPADIIQVIDADASQTKVIEEVRRGSSLVVQGPPGTGKSQTITNIIAAAAHDGKTVLFVAEKMAALSVVHDRLVKAGLQDICLELHSRSANKKALVQELERTLHSSAKSLQSTVDTSGLRQTRDELNRISTLLHTPSSVVAGTPFEALSEIIGFIGQGVPSPAMSIDGLERLDKEKRISVQQAIEAYVTTLQIVISPERHPFRNTTELELQPTDLSRLESELASGASEIRTLLDNARVIAKSTYYSEPTTLEELQTFIEGLSILAQAPERIKNLVRFIFEIDEQVKFIEALAVGKEWSDAYEVCKYQYSSSAWIADVETIRPALEKGKNAWLNRLFGKYRKASGELALLLSGPLPKTPEKRLDHLNEISKIQMLRSRLADEESWLQSKLGAEWRGEHTSFSQILVAAKWGAKIRTSVNFVSADQLVQALEYLEDPTHIKKLKMATNSCISKLKAITLKLKFNVVIEKTPLEEFSIILQSMATNTDKYYDWVKYQRAKQHARNVGASEVIEAITLGKLQAEKASQVFSYACAEARWNAFRDANPAINELARLDRHELVKSFRKLEQNRIDTTKNLVLSHHFSQMPRSTMGEMGIIRGEIGRKRGHKPIRWLMTQAGRMLQRIKPVMLMSPISVAQFLPLGEVTFDLLVIDEASQVRPEDALGVIVRAKQIVVVGDQKQLPPTSFFDRLVDDVDDNEDDDPPIGAGVADMESILSLCEARGLRSRMLEWHYRSRDPSLIRVSNAEFYNDGLILPPSPLQLDPDYGLKFTRVPGVYSRGRTGLGRQGTNRIEAESIAKAVATHAHKWSDLSLGVVAFSKAQADMITEMLEVERRKNPQLDSFLREGKFEDVFVKNIENVQGDERDVILISVGYGPQEPNGRLAEMIFGPINSDGGERRLNVLFSRARVRCEVFASFDPGDIDTGRVKRDGPRVLKRFLEFAKTGIMEEKILTGLSADSPFEEDVANVIRSLGYIANPQVGSAGFRVDLGIIHPERPGQYILAVECDGATYHSALWARERDRLRQGVLEGLGWRFHRIWSTDWFYNRAREIEKLKEVLASAISTSPDGIRVKGSNSGEKSTVTKNAITDQSYKKDLNHLRIKAPAYVMAKKKIKSSTQPHDTDPNILRNLIIEIVETEGPIHEDEVARRVTSAFRLSRTGKRIVEVTNNAIQSAIELGMLEKQGGFVMTKQQIENPPVRDRSKESGNLLKAEYLSPLEISAAAKKITSDSGEMIIEEMVKAIAHLLGYQRVSSDLSETITKSLSNLDSKTSVRIKA